MEDTDAGGFTHWVVFNIPSNVLELAEGMPKTLTLANGAAQGRNDFGDIGWGGPAPPPGLVHHYYFRLYALDKTFTFASPPTKSQLLTVMQGHIIAQTEYMGTHEST
jgi:Raf kinase inhibitor-like YbhB/YbcL family protein